MLWIFERRPWFKWRVFIYIASVGIGKTKWMRCLTFSDLAPGNEFAGRRLGRDQQCTELSLRLFKSCRPGPSIGPLPLLIAQNGVRKQRGRRWDRRRHEDLAPRSALWVKPWTKLLFLLTAEEKQARVTSLSHIFVSFSQMMESNLWQLPKGSISTFWQLLVIRTGCDGFLGDWFSIRFHSPYH